MTNIQLIFDLLTFGLWMSKQIAKLWRSKGCKDVPVFNTYSIHEQLFSIGFLGNAVMTTS